MVAQERFGKRWGSGSCLRRHFMARPCNRVQPVRIELKMRERRSISWGR